MGEKGAEMSWGHLAHDASTRAGPGLARARPTARPSSWLSQCPAPVFPQNCSILGKSREAARGSAGCAGSRRSPASQGLALSPRVTRLPRTPLLWDLPLLTEISTPLLQPPSQRSHNTLRSTNYHDLVKRITLSGKTGSCLSRGVER